MSGDDTRCDGCFSELDSASTCSRCGFGAESAAEVQDELGPGTLLRERYRVGRVIGRGGFGITYLGRDESLHRIRAIKEYFPRGILTRTGTSSRVTVHSGQKEVYQRGMAAYLAEARLLAQFDRHPGVVSLTDFFEQNGTAYLVMEYLEGETLRHYVERNGGRLPFEHALYFMLPVLDALAAVHGSGITHRDVSPDNIFLTTDSRSKLIDFGAAREGLLSRAQGATVIVRDHFAPPEQYAREGRQGPWTDIYAAAATFYYTLTGESPPTGPERLLTDELCPPSDHGVAIPPAAEGALMRSLSLRPEERPERVEWLSEQLQVGLCTKSDAGERSAEIGSDLPSDTYGETPPASDGFAAPRELSVPAHDLTQRVQRMPRHISRSVTDGLARVPSWALRGSAAALVAVASLGAIGWLLASRPAIAPARALLPTPAAPSSEAPHAGTDRATPQAAGATTQAPAPSPESRPPTGARTQTGTRSPTSLADPPEPSVASAADAGPGLRSDTQELARRRFPGGSNAASAPKEPSDPDPRVASWTPDAAPTSPAPASAGAGTQGSVVSGLGTPDSASGGRDAPGRGPDPGDGLVELTIRSNVRGDTLEIDGEFVGSTERRTLRLTPGRHTLRISKTGYATEERTVLLRPDAPDQEVNVVLTRTVSPDARRLRRALSELDASDLDVRIAAIAEIETSAQRGDARAQRVLGRLYARGEDVPRDERLALSWYRKAAHAGSARAQHELALRLEYGRWDPLGAGALEAAPQEGRLQRLLGWFTDDGERRNRKRELARAFLQRLEGNRGDEFGGPRLTGDPQDFPEAFTWYTKAAEQGVGAAQERAAFMMAAGRGTSQNLITAFRRWFMRAAENGQRDSQYVVGMCYLLDVGIGRHPTNAAAGECWLRRAAAQGQPDARVELESRGIDPDLRPPAACRVDYLP